MATANGRRAGEIKAQLPFFSLEMVGLMSVAIVVAAVACAVVAATPNDNVCFTAPAVTTTVIVNECGQSTTPAASPSESEARSTAPLPVETSWLPSSPAPPAPAPPASAEPAPGPSGSFPPAPPASSGGSSGSEPSKPGPTPTATNKPTPSPSYPGSTPSSSSEPEQPPSNAAPLSGVSLGMGSVVAVGMAINAAVAALV
ncbi:uncharacterized protein N0V89_009638 [Didymosphaeria variabile]|uniref:Uncharacterized protein n=1 Tax=Didymosphaeria variabile TaxID=1932322 RepID=A0A9W9C7H2_9PLEO|nr:uncharacterized protein N0V89_009638 [Didymosphaeria variabile]KAJ4348266.1 hypothetical protein N0V89_009638 [Didymosphaeria variabile]